MTHTHVMRRLDAVQRHGGIVARAARELGIAQATLSQWMRRRGLRGRSRRGRTPIVQVRSTQYGLEKRCVSCREWLPLDECFNANPAGAFGRENACRDCRKVVRDQKRAAGEWTT